MTQDEQNLIEDLIRILKKYDKCAFVGTFCDMGCGNFSTFRIVWPGYREEPFIKIQDGLTDLVNTETGGKNDRVEKGYYKDPDRKI